MRKRTRTGMAVLATMAMLAATGTALAGGGVEIQLTQERPTAGGTGVLVAQRTLTNDLARIQSSEIDQRPDPGSGGSGGLWLGGSGFGSRFCGGLFCRRSGFSCGAGGVRTSRCGRLGR